MNNWIIVPAVLPALTAAFLLLTLRYQLEIQRVVSIVATLALLGVDIGLLVHAAQGAPQVYQLGAWPAPFGIVLVLDRLSATMLVLTGVLALGVIACASAGWDTKGRLFHPLFQFQLLGINGALLTGDVFNLFVFFEVMLIASYGLMLHGGGPARLKAGFHYVAINLVASTLFLVAVGLIYSVTGTLNMADLAAKVPAVSPADVGLLKAGGLLLFLVFATKASLVPLHWWLPATYASTSAPAAAIFMVMTKVGAYSILRFHGLVFGPEAGATAGLVVPFVLPAASATLLLGSLGVLGSRTLRGLSAFAVVSSMGTLLLALGLFDGPGIASALYYLVHSTLAGAALFLIAGLVAERRGAATDALSRGPMVRGGLLLGGLFLLAAIAMVGLPPLSGFLGKVLVMQALRVEPAWPWAWALILATSLIMTLGFARAGSVLFWAGSAMPQARPADRPGNKPEDKPGERAPLALAQPVTGIALLLVLLAAWTAAAGPAMDWLDGTAAQVLDRGQYVGAVLGPRGD